MRLLVDEDLASEELVARLRKAGHYVETPTRGALDPAVWRYAQECSLALLTRNGPDFLELAARMPGHYGLLVVYGERERSKSMTPGEIAAAIDLVGETFGDGLGDRALLLNEWRRQGRTTSSR